MRIKLQNVFIIADEEGDVGVLHPANTSKDIILASTIAFLRAANSSSVERGGNRLARSLGRLVELLGQTHAIHAAMKTVLFERERIRLHTASRPYDLTRAAFVEALKGSQRTRASGVAWPPYGVDEAAGLIADIMMAPLVAAGATPPVKERVAPRSVLASDAGEGRHPVASYATLRLALIESALISSMFEPRVTAIAPRASWVPAAQYVADLDVVCEQYRSWIAKAVAKVKHFENLVAVAKHVGWRGDSLDYPVDVTPFLQNANLMLDPDGPAAIPASDHTVLLHAPNGSDAFSILAAHPSLRLVSAAEFVGMHDRVRHPTVEMAGLAAVLVTKRYAAGDDGGAILTKIGADAYAITRFAKGEARFPGRGSLGDAFLPTPAMVSHWAELLKERRPEAALLDTLGDKAREILAACLADSIDYSFTGPAGTTSAARPDVLYVYKAEGTWPLYEKLATLEADHMFRCDAPWVVVAHAVGPFGTSVYPTTRTLRSLVVAAGLEFVDVMHAGKLAYATPLNRERDITLKHFAGENTLAWKPEDVIERWLDIDGHITYDPSAILAARETMILAEAVWHLVAAPRAELRAWQPDLLTISAADPDSQFRTVVGSDALKVLAANADIAGGGEVRADEDEDRLRRAGSARIMWLVAGSVLESLRSPTARALAQELIRQIVAERVSAGTGGKAVIRRSANLEDAGILLDLRAAVAAEVALGFIPQDIVAKGSQNWIRRATAEDSAIRPMLLSSLMLEEKGV